MSLKATEPQSKKEKGYRKLLMWQKGKLFLKEVYIHTDKFPSSETFGLTSQIRRATLSYLLNIVEGQRRTSKKEFLRFLNTAESSLAEVEACLEIAYDLGYLNFESYELLEKKRQELAKMTSSFTKKVADQLRAQ